MNGIQISYLWVTPLQYNELYFIETENHSYLELRLLLNNRVVASASQARLNLIGVEGSSSSSLLIKLKNARKLRDNLALPVYTGIMERFRHTEMCVPMLMKPTVIEAMNQFQPEETVPVPVPTPTLKVV